MDFSKTILTPDWDVPEWVGCAYTTRCSGYSQGDFSAFNLGHHVNEPGEIYETNRNALKEYLHLSRPPVWLQQVHSNEITRLNLQSQDYGRFDGSFTDRQGLPCAIMTADCLPVLMVNVKSKTVAAIHAGWRGLASGILERAVSILSNDNNAEIKAWLGPAIGIDAYEVDHHVYRIFRAKINTRDWFYKGKEKDKYHVSLTAIAKEILNNSNLHHVTDCGLCTYSDESRFYSYRRSQDTGRQATLIWIK